MYNMLKKLNTRYIIIQFNYVFLTPKRLEPGRSVYFTGATWRIYVQDEVIRIAALRAQNHTKPE